MHYEFIEDNDNTGYFCWYWASMMRLPWKRVSDASDWPCRGHLVPVRCGVVCRTLAAEVDRRQNDCGGTCDRRAARPPLSKTRQWGDALVTGKLDHTAQHPVCVIARRHQMPSRLKYFTEFVPYSTLYIQMVSSTVVWSVFLLLTNEPHSLNGFRRAIVNVDFSASTKCF